MVRGRRRKGKGPVFLPVWTGRLPIVLCVIHVANICEVLLCARHSPECSGRQTQSLPMAGWGVGGSGGGSKQLYQLAVAPWWKYPQGPVGGWRWGEKHSLKDIKGKQLLSCSLKDKQALSRCQGEAVWSRIKSIGKAQRPEGAWHVYRNFQVVLCASSWVCGNIGR